ncbi:MAG: TrkH family potassium uptake protein [Clostridiales bacterium]|nr:TrkH family potassium uptake protein [Clostridiales bacterium]
MNYKVISYVLSKIMGIEAIVLLLPLMVAFYYREGNYLCFLIPILICAAIGVLSLFLKPKDKRIYAKEGFVIVGLAWIFMSLAGALPAYLSGAIPSYIDSFFETVSGFTTTGATILNAIEGLPKGVLFWRSFTHWLGGMGVLVFLIAIVPKSDTATMHLVRAESTGPKIGKLTSKLNVSARILYTIYTVLTVILVLLLLIGGMPFFDSVVTAFGTAGTGGFAVKNASIAAYNSPYITYVISIFMTLFAVNFSMFYFMILGKFGMVFRNEELRTFLLIIFVSVGIISFNIYPLYNNAEMSFRDALFQVTATISTTGFSTADFVKWPYLSQGILLMLMFFGGCAGSTGGGMKIIRIIMLVKSTSKDVRKMLSPRSVLTVKVDKKPVEASVLTGLKVYLMAYLIVLVTSVLLICINNFDMTTNITSVITCLNNVGPGLGDLIGPTGNFSSFSVLSKIVLCFDMLAGRLDIFPVLVLLTPTTWKMK